MQENPLGNVLVLESPPSENKSSELSPYALAAIKKISERTLWENRPDGLGLYIGLSEDGTVSRVDVFDTNTKKTNVSNAPNRKFSAVVISVNGEFMDFEKISDLVEEYSPNLRRNRGNAEEGKEPKEAKSGAVFVVAPFSEENKQALHALIDTSGVLVETKAVEKHVKGRDSYIVAEGRATHESIHKEVNLIEKSKNREFDYIKAMQGRVVRRYKNEDSRITKVDFAPINKRLEHSVNHKKNVGDLGNGLDVILEFNCGCNIHKDRDDSNEYLKHCSDGEHLLPKRLPEENADVKEDVKPPVQENKKTEEFEYPACDCGLRMTKWDPRAAKGGRWVCSKDHS